MNYYNENDPKAAAWLRELIARGLIPNGYVDERSIIDVKPHELIDYTQQHFFAGIGGWSYALRLAGWPESKPVRTGSCPCQPFSQTGKMLGTSDPRHLWPHFRDIITFGEATITLGEQVASPLGREWLAGIRADLEGLGYEVGAADLCAAGVGAPHIRQRLYWMAHPKRIGWRGWKNGYNDGEKLETVPENKTERSSGFVRMGNTNVQGSQGRNERIFECEHEWPPGTTNLAVFCEDGKTRRFEPGAFPMVDGFPQRVGILRGSGNAIVPQLAAEFIKASIEAIQSIK